MVMRMSTNGTVHWNSSNGTEILFPETKIVIDGKEKLRGAAPVCCPVFGPAPTDGPYTGINMPQHGLVRDCWIDRGKVGPDNRADYQFAPEMAEDRYISTSFDFSEPWPHEVSILAKEVYTPKVDTHGMFHHILLKPNETNKAPMPYSIGFHPYFKTNGGRFTLRHGENEWGSENFQVDRPFFVANKVRESLDIELEHGTISLRILKGYRDYCIWSDQPDKYICVEPVLTDHTHGYLMLSPGHLVDCSCLMTYKPKA